MRLFVAINLPADLRQRLFDATMPLRNGRFPLRWVMPDSMHLTLKFLGETADDQVDAVGGVLREVSARRGPLALSLGAMGAFPRLRRPRVLWLGVEASEGLLDLQRTIEQSLVPLGFAAETRRYSPHLTLARARNDARSVAFNGLESVAQSIEITEAPVEIRTIELMRSHIGRAGATYEVVGRFDLARE